MTRVMVIGNAAGGKSTLCQSLARVHDLPLFRIDDILWRPGWVQTPAAEFEVAHDTLLNADTWLIDGYGPWSSVQARLATCDTIVLVDLPLHIHFWWAAKRQVKSAFRTPLGVPNGCRLWPVTWRLFRMIWELHRTMHAQLIQAVYDHASNARIIHIRSPKDLNRFIQNPV